jgi:hypothetical protein
MLVNVNLFRCSLIGAGFFREGLMKKPRLVAGVLARVECGRPS